MLSLRWDLLLFLLLGVLSEEVVQVFSVAHVFVVLRVLNGEKGVFVLLTKRLKKVKPFPSLSAILIMIKVSLSDRNTPIW